MINTFIKIEGPAINGGGSAKGHEGDLNVISWNHAWHQPTSATRLSAGSGTLESVSHSPFTFTKEMDSSTDDLIKMCWTGKHINKITLKGYRSDGDTGTTNIGVPYIAIVMEGCIVQDYSISGSQGGMPMESVSITYGKVTYTYTGTDKMTGKAGAAQPVSHDLTSNVVS
jgi:type VI secretion system secreted protein Hcp